MPASRFAPGGGYCGGAPITMTAVACGGNLGAGIPVTVTNAAGTLSLTQYTNAASQAVFSLPPGTYTWACTGGTTGPPAGFLATSSGFSVVGTAGGTITVGYAVDLAHGYFCDGCGRAVTSLTVTPGPTGAGSAIISVQPDGSVATPWVASGSTFVRWTFGTVGHAAFITRVYQGGSPAPASYLLSTGQCTPYAWTDGTRTVHP